MAISASELGTWIGIVVKNDSTYATNQRNSVNMLLSLIEKNASVKDALIIKRQFLTPLGYVETSTKDDPDYVYFVKGSAPAVKVRKTPYPENSLWRDS